MKKTMFLLIVAWAAVITAGLMSEQLNIGWSVVTRADAQAPVLLLLLYVCLHVLVKAVKNWLRYREYSELR